ncbi:interleukin-27 subunit alpha-like isoform X2 [Bufo gargarizans]|uniref:interleukin-27 subunit alpha-like isoform X2 n=1 Tax=Bufo gargarizans TaxID=30331 RepID=UPI001CF32D8C|nr:interleukin-27 subunit alpha-like isoform X2 [Bufo gargarizans]
MNTMIAGHFWLPIIFSGIVLRWPVEGRPISNTTTTTKSVSLGHDFRKTLTLSRKLLQESRLLTHDYRMWKLPGSHLDFTGSFLNLTSVAINITTWLKLQPSERLRFLSDTLQVYPVYLGELEKWEKEETKEGSPSPLKSSVTHVRLDLRDLLHHIHRQMSLLGLNHTKVSSQEHPWGGARNWSTHLKMYQVLRTMEQTLLRAMQKQ